SRTLGIGDMPGGTRWPQLMLAFPGQRCSPGNARPSPVPPCRGTGEAGRDHPRKGDDTPVAVRTGSVMVRDAAGPPAGPAPNEQPELVGERAVGAVETDQPSVATESPRRARHGKQRTLLYLTLPGCWGALIFGCLSFTPSLLPRGGVIQGVVFG